ncbi:unnamed protein product [Heterobilharzia americana]|nr:unnamed protein product [Heterobilharzia americana]
MTPNLVCEVHKSFLQAGCDVISTNTFCASPETLTGALNITYAEAVELMSHSVRLVQRAISAENCLKRQNRKLSILIAGSLGPYDACIANKKSSKNTKNNDKTFEELVEFHYKRAEILIASGADFLAWNKISSLTEVSAISEVMHRLPPSASCWITIDSPDGQTSTAGLPLSQFALEVEKCEKIFGVGVCCNVPHNLIGQALANLYSIYDPCESGNEEGYHPPPCTIRGRHSEESIINGCEKKILILIANDGQIWIPPSGKHLRKGQLLTSTVALGARRWVNNMLQWSKTRETRNLGGTYPNEKEVCKYTLPLAQWVGGCCRVEPDYIKRLAEKMKPDEYATILSSKDTLYPYLTELSGLAKTSFKNENKRGQIQCNKKTVKKTKR